MKVRCDRCGKLEEEINSREDIGYLEMPIIVCMKCYMMKKTDKDRTGRYSKKDKAINKQVREWLY